MNCSSVLYCFLWSCITLVYSTLSVVVDLVASCFVSKAPGEMEGMFPLLTSVILSGGIGKNKLLNPTTDQALSASHNSWYSVQISAFRLLSCMLSHQLFPVQQCNGVCRYLQVIIFFLNSCRLCRTVLEVSVVAFMVGILGTFSEIFFCGF